MVPGLGCVAPPANGSTVPFVEPSKPTKGSPAVDVPLSTELNVGGFGARSELEVIVDGDTSGNGGDCGSDSVAVLGRDTELPKGGPLPMGGFIAAFPWGDGMFCFVDRISGVAVLATLPPNSSTFGDGNVGRPWSSAVVLTVWLTCCIWPGKAGAAGSRAWLFHFLCCREAQSEKSSLTVVGVSCSAMDAVRFSANAPNPATLVPGSGRLGAAGIVGVELSG